MGIHLDVNGVFLRAEHLHLSDSADHGDALRDPRFGVIIQRVEGERGGSQSYVENGLVRRVYLGESRRRRHPRGQKTRCLCDGGLHVHRGAIQVPAQVEFQSDLRGSERVRRCHRAQPRDHRKLILKRRRDGGRHRFRACARQIRGHEEGREVHIGEVADRQRTIRDHSEERDRQHHEAGRDRTVYEDLRYIHRLWNTDEHGSQRNFTDRFVPHAPTNDK